MPLLRTLICLFVLISLFACEQAPPSTGQILSGKWLTQADGSPMLDPQPSGLVWWRDKLLTVSDRSALDYQQQHIHLIEPKSARVEITMPIRISGKVAAGCFAEYLSGEPDYEALAVNPDNDHELLIVTEDASSSSLSSGCAARFAESNATNYPALLLRLQIQNDNSWLMTDARPLAYPADNPVGDYPNDGLEGLSYAPDGWLYLAKEKDQQGQPRIFKLQLGEGFWQQEGFAQLADANLTLPGFAGGNHPINGMHYYQTPQGKGYLLAAARNDNQIWVIDLAGEQATKILPVQYQVPVAPGDHQCEQWELMNNSSLEGAAVNGQTLWLINDPWKRRYHDNIECPVNAQKYRDMVPLLFKMPIQPEWFLQESQ